MIVIISDTADAQIYPVMEELTRLGADHGVFNATDFPTATTVTMQVGGDASSCILHLYDGRAVSADDVSAVWYRKPDLVRLHPSIADHERQFTFKECQAGLYGLYDALAGAHWISPLRNIRAASNKLTQLRTARRLGLDVPRSLFTNDVDEAQGFLSSLDGTGVIYKAIGESALVQADGPWDIGYVTGQIFTTLLDEAMIVDGLPRLSACPVLFQEYVDKEVELRITVVGDTVFAVELHSQGQPAAQVDWRQGDPLAMDHRAVDLPDDVEARCRALVRAFDLQFGAIDMIRTPDGRYVFLEINPNGQYGWIEDLTPLRISHAIAERLVGVGGELES